MTALARDMDFTDPNTEAPEANTDDKGGGGDEEAGEDADPDRREDDDPDVEAEARALGWVPEHEWDDVRAEKKGISKPKVFMTARQWLDRMEETGPIQRAKFKSMQQELREVKQQNTEIYTLMQEQRKTHLAALERARAEERAKIEQEREEAFENGDKAAFKAADAKLAEFDAKKPGEDGAEQPANGEKRDPPEVVEFKKQNPWFTTDPRLTNAMIDEFGEVKQANPGMSFREQMAEARRILMRRYPEKFGVNPRRENARGQMPPSGGSPDSTVERRFAALQPEEKAMWDRTRKLVESKGGKITKAEWLKEIGR